ncbi:hypothetical protein PR048_032415 [Dryococelus australis]|uniref:Uncharacterized protein n=1 Tax=Dryococelus australis TaxID=614101 RepID=A0ABQ9G244_9NEOP|nr:hypothetical protein PR048_032415 [Dryococelus australis]
MANVGRKLSVLVKCPLSDIPMDVNHLEEIFANLSNQLRETGDVTPGKRNRNKCVTGGEGEINVRADVVLNSQGISRAIARQHFGATAAERLAYSPPTKANRARSPAGSPDFRKWESCRTISFLGNLPFAPPFHSDASPYLPQSPSSAKYLHSSFILRLDSSVLFILEPQLSVHWLLPHTWQLWDSQGVSSKACYWPRGVQGGSNKLRSNCKGDFTIYTDCQAPTIVGNDQEDQVLQMLMLDKDCWLGSPLVDDRPIMNSVKYRVVSGVVWTNRTTVSSNTDTNRTGVLAVVGVGKIRDFISDKIYFKHVYTEVAFAIGSEFIRHALDDSVPIADFQGDKQRILYCQMWGNNQRTKI